MFRKALAGIACLAAASFAITAFGEDAVTADPAHYKVEYENDKVRVIRVNYGPGEKSVMHTHGPNVAVFLTDISVRMHLPDGTSEDIDAPRGATQWAQDENHMPENIGSEPFEVILVEIKD
ncbi:MAG: hypothetical protein R3192_08460 [Woeseiaceae bacterium]|nr:hypothetical protein [Woeseiaceae bacterium]